MFRTRFLRTSRPRFPRLALHVEILEARTVPSFLPAVRYDVGGAAANVALADFNRDGQPDLAVTNTFATVARVSVLLNGGKGALGPPVHYANLSVAAAGDFNGDDNPDLAVMRPHSTFGYVGVGVLLGNGMSLQDIGATSIARSSHGIATGDFNGDGCLDLVMGHHHGSTAGGSVSVLLGNGDGAFKDAVSFVRAQGATHVAVSDFNGDGHADLAVSNGVEGVSVLLGQGDGSFQDTFDLDAEFPTHLAVGDFNRDGLPDLAVTQNLLRNSVGVWLGRGAGKFANTGNYDVDVGPSRLVVADLNGDGAADLVTANLAGTVSVLLGQGEGFFKNALHTRVDFVAYNPDLAAADFDGDGYPDLAMTTPIASDRVAVLLNAADWDTFGRGIGLPPSHFDVWHAPSPEQSAAVPVLLRADTSAVPFFVSLQQDKGAADLPQKRQPIFDAGLSLPTLDDEEIQYLL